MSEVVQIISDKIQIRSIKLLGGNIKASSEVDGNQIASFNVKYGISHDLNYKDKLFRFVISIIIEALDDSDNELGSSAEYNIEYIFHVENLSDYIKKVDHDQKEIFFQPVLTHTLVNIVYSTARGIILSRTQGTLMEGVILPVVDTKSLLRSLEENKVQSADAMRL